MNSMGQQESPISAPPRPLPWGRLDKSMSPRVGDFAQKNYPLPNYPGKGGPQGTLDKAITAILNTILKQVKTC